MLWFFAKVGVEVLICVLISSSSVVDGSFWLSVVTLEFSSSRLGFFHELFSLLGWDGIELLGWLEILILFCEDHICELEFPIDEEVVKSGLW